MWLCNFISNFFNLLSFGLVLLPLLLENAHARIGYFWHITDLHLDTIYSTQGDVLRSCWRIDRQAPSSSNRSPGRFGDYLCDSPWSLIESAAKAMKSRQGDNVEFVLWTGDGLSHSSHPLFETKKLEIMRNITDLLGRTFSSQFVFPVLGHEDGTTTNFRHMGELWRHWLPTEALHTFEKGGYYSIEQTKSRLRIIALNTNFMRHDPKYSQSHLAAVRQRTPPNTMMGGPETPEYKNYYYHHGTLHQHHSHSGDWSTGYGYNAHHRGISAIPGTIDGSNGGRVSALSEFENQDTEKQWIWLEDVLSKSKNNKETVYIVGHIPPGSDERHIGFQQNGHTTFTESNNKRYLDLVRKYSSIIQGQFFGHLHSDSFRIIYDDKGTPVSWIMISPSVTPRKMSVGSNNPAMRLYKFDTDSGQVLDYTQYFMDLQSANSLGEPNWVPEYNLTHYYALSDISAISLHNFVDRFTSNDISWFHKYYRANTVRYQTDQCEGVCMLNHYCAITRVDYKEFRQCLEKEQSALRSHAIPSLSAACPSLVLVCALAVSCCRAMAAVLSKLILRLHVQKRQQIKFDAMTMIKIKSATFALLILQHVCRMHKSKRATTTSTTTTNSTTTITTTATNEKTGTAIGAAAIAAVAIKIKMHEDYMQQRSITMQPKEDFLFIIPNGKSDKGTVANCSIIGGTGSLQYYVADDDDNKQTKDHAKCLSTTVSAVALGMAVAENATDSGCDEYASDPNMHHYSTSSISDVSCFLNSFFDQNSWLHISAMPTTFFCFIFAQCQIILSSVNSFVGVAVALCSYLPLKLRENLIKASQRLKLHVNCLH